MVADPERIHTPSNCARLSCASAPETTQTRSARTIFLIAALSADSVVRSSRMTASSARTRRTVPWQWLAETPRSRNHAIRSCPEAPHTEIREVIQTPARAGGDRHHATDAQQLERYFATDERVAVGPFDEPLLHSSVALGDLERDLRVRVSNVDISDAAGEREHLRAVEVH